MSRAAFACVLLFVGVSMFRTLVPGLFTIDETTYIASVVSLRSGGLTLPGYEGLRPSVEHYFFDPEPGPSRPVVPPTQRFPPLYAFLAWPFSFAGVVGLFALNALATLLTTGLLFLRLQSLARRPFTPWLGALAFLFGGHVLEYALGLWPHMTSVALCASAFVLVGLARERDDLRFAALAGVVCGVAIGVRYPNVVIAAGFGLTLALFARRRTKSALTYVLGLAPPLALSSYCNHARFGSFNPISKGGQYLSVGAGARDSGLSSMLADLWPSLGSRVIDYRLRPARGYAFFAESPDPTSGAYVWLDIAKKSWLQSSPWVAAALLGLLLVWRRRVEPSPAGRELRALSIAVYAVLVAFAFAGSARTDGFCFNQRYLLDLVPLAAMALALLLDEYALRVLPSALGAAVGFGTGYYVMFHTARAEHQVAVMSAPLWLALPAAAGMVWAVFGRRDALLWAGVAAGLAYAPCVHILEDVRASLARRSEVAAVAESLVGRLPEGAAVLAWHSYRDAVAPLLLEQRLTIVEPSRDAGVDAARVTAELLARGRRVFAIGSGADTPTLSHLVGDFGVKHIERGDVSLIELGSRPLGAGAAAAH